MDDITQILTFAVKKELAERYFSGRKQILDDIAAYTRQLQEVEELLPATVGLDLRGLSLLLQSPQVIDRFLQLAGFPAGLFCDTAPPNTPATRQQAFQGLSCRGFSRKRRFTHLFFALYQQLAVHIDTYRTARQALLLEQQTIVEQIRLFERQNDLDSILSFLRQFDSPDPAVSGLLHTPSSPLAQSRLVESLRIEPPPFPGLLPDLPRLPPPADIRKALDSIVTAAFALPRDWRLRDATRTGDVSNPAAFS